MPESSGVDYQRLIDMAEQVDAMGTDHFPAVLWTTPSGVIVGRGVFEEPPGDGDVEPGGRTGVAYMEEGQEFPPHQQEYCVEHLIVFNGVLLVSLMRDPIETYVLGPGDHIKLEPGVVHVARAKTRCCVQGTTIPKDGGYPDARTIEPHPWGVRDGNGEGGQ